MFYMLLRWWEEKFWTSTPHIAALVCSFRSNQSFLPLSPRSSEWNWNSGKSLMLHHICLHQFRLLLPFYELCLSKLQVGLPDFLILLQSDCERLVMISAFWAKKHVHFLWPTWACLYNNRWNKLLALEGNEFVSGCVVYLREHVSVKLWFVYYHF